MITAFGPGRVNLIGEHTDYNDGLALPFAIADGVTVRAEATAGDLIEASADDLGETDRFLAASPEPADGWRAFVRGAVAELTELGVAVEPVRLTITGTIARGSGLSSSAALEVALVLALLSLAGEAGDHDRIELARLCSRIENDWVGAQTGLLDQLASLCGQPDHALRIDFRSLEVAPVRLDLVGHKLVTLDSGEEHSLATSGYNERRRECAEACEQLGIESLRDATTVMAQALAEPLGRRVRHVIGENERVEQTVAALAAGDLAAVGELLDASHASLRENYEVSTDAVEAAVGRLREAGALGARIMGGGFGGYVLGLLPPGAEPPDGADEVTPGAGARIIEPNG
ncbi:MAG TPA: galactokinase family protein [Solirubrobacteraceae bacterium]|nr:galactokinase family protein [Solirubrobacteraceae bacterium]